jgi:hypothetical protein
LNLFATRTALLQTTAWLIAKKPFNKDLATARERLAHYEVQLNAPN